MSSPGILFRAGMHLCGRYYDPDDQKFKTRECFNNDVSCLSKVELNYLNPTTLKVLTGAGIVIGGLGIVALLASLGHLPALVAFLHVGSHTHVLMIIGATATAVGGADALTHVTMIGLKTYALTVWSSRPVKLANVEDSIDDIAKTV